MVDKINLAELYNSNNKVSFYLEGVIVINGVDSNLKECMTRIELDEIDVDSVLVRAIKTSIESEIFLRKSSATRYNTAVRLNDFIGFIRNHNKENNSCIENKSIAFLEWQNQLIREGKSSATIRGNVSIIKSLLEAACYSGKFNDDEVSFLMSINRNIIKSLPNDSEARDSLQTFLPEANISDLELGKSVPATICLMLNELLRQREVIKKSNGYHDFISDFLNKNIEFKKISKTGFLLRNKKGEKDKVLLLVQKFSARWIQLLHGTNDKDVIDRLNLGVYGSSKEWSLSEKVNGIQLIPVKNTKERKDTRKVSAHCSPLEMLWPTFSELVLVRWLFSYLRVYPAYINKLKFEDIIFVMNGKTPKQMQVKYDKKRSGTGGTSFESLIYRRGHIVCDTLWKWYCFMKDVQEYLPIKMKGLLVPRLWQDTFFTNNQFSLKSSNTNTSWISALSMGSIRYGKGLLEKEVESLFLRYLAEFINQKRVGRFKKRQGGIPITAFGNTFNLLDQLQRIDNGKKLTDENSSHLGHTAEVSRSVYLSRSNSDEIKNRRRNFSLIVSRAFEEDMLGPAQILLESTKFVDLKEAKKLLNISNEDELKDSLEVEGFIKKTGFSERVVVKSPIVVAMMISRIDAIEKAEDRIIEANPGAWATRYIPELGWMKGVVDLMPRKLINEAINILKMHDIPVPYLT